jgi:hypothetical protein
MMESEGTLQLAVMEAEVDQLLAALDRLDEELELSLGLNKKVYKEKNKPKKKSKEKSSTNRTF